MACLQRHCGANLALIRNMLLDTDVELESNMPLTECSLSGDEKCVGGWKCVAGRRHAAD